LAAAERAAGELRAAGYVNLRVERTPTKSIWERLFGRKTFLCMAENYAVPSEAGVFETTDRMKALAGKHGGVYDGWEASVEK
jgi:hypothetical protein